jgi:hypothetical protein
MSSPIVVVFEPRFVVAEEGDGIGPKSDCVVGEGLWMEFFDGNMLGLRVGKEEKDLKTTWLV